MWLVAIVVSCCALATSCASFYTKRKEWSCLTDGHGFSGRYSIDAPNSETIEALGKQFSAYSYHRLEAMELAQKKTYICDVCTYCGETKEVSGGTQAEDTR